MSEKPLFLECRVKIEVEFLASEIPSIKKVQQSLDAIGFPGKGFSFPKYKITLLEGEFSESETPENSKTTESK